MRQVRPAVHRAPHAPATIHEARTAGLARWRGVARAERRYHWNDYVRPSGWYEHRWVVGETLPAAWYANDYWITDWGQFGLMGPPIGFVWVRVGDDAVLIDTENGEVLRVVYGVFY